MRSQNHHGWLLVSLILNNEQLLENLVALNAERATEEANGLIRWLRPDYQNPTATPAEVLQAILAKSKTNITGTPSGTTNRSLWIGLDTDAFEITAGAEFGLMNKYSNKCLDVQGVSQNDGSNVYLWNCHWKGNQTWKLIDAGDDFYNLRVSHSGKQLDASRNSNEYNSVIQWSEHGDWNQQ